VRPAVSDDLAGLRELRDAGGPPPHEPFRLSAAEALEKEFEEHGLIDEDGARLAVTTLDGRLLGTVSYFYYEPIHRSAELGVWIARPEDRGKGHGYEAQALLCGYLFHHLGLERVEAHTYTENLAERRCLEKLGFRHEGTRRRASWSWGGYHDYELYGLLREEWLQGRA
jgi:aminoglycoside 6'-N-acetyltransferase